MPNFFATCPKGLESLLFDEISSLNVNECKETVAGVSFSAKLEQALELCLKTRYASKILYVLSRFYCETDSELYLGTLGIAWEKYFDVNKTIAVDFTGQNNYIRNTQYGALKIKDGIVDRFNQVCKQRPNVDKEQPDVTIVGHLRHEEAIVCIDLSGFPLHQRQIHRGTGIAPIKENLACAMLKRAGFDNNTNLLDPMCGSGTILIEAAMLAANMAPGLNRTNYGFEKLSIFDENLQSHWLDIRAKAHEDFKAGLQSLIEKKIEIIGFDTSERAIEIANDNIQKAGFEAICKVECRPIEDLVNPFTLKKECLIVTNPPYGVRMGNFNSLISLYHTIGSKLKEHFVGSKAAIISSSLDLLSCLKLKAHKTYKLFNGQLPCSLRVYEINESIKDQDKHDGIVDFKNRLKKNLKAVTKYAGVINTNAYRIYDADLPEYKAAIDYYNGYYVLYEYVSKNVEEYKAKAHLFDMIAAIQEVCQCDGENIIVKGREKQKGTLQYESEEEKQDTFYEVNEDNKLYLVNLYDYLDTGLFLDSRIIREMIFKNAKDKDFLNLFCYTASASVAAALGGAKSTLSVDMSKTYLDWGVKNFKLNNINLKDHKFIQQDCLYFLSYNTFDKFDLVYLDPPTFSNSKRMDGTLDIVRDHVQLLANLTLHLKDEAIVYFCTNKRNFKLDSEVVAQYGYRVSNLTDKSIPFDFKQNKGIHSFYILNYNKALNIGEVKPLVSKRATPKWSKEISKIRDFKGQNRDHDIQSPKFSRAGEFSKDFKRNRNESNGKRDRFDKRNSKDSATPQRKVRIFGPEGVVEQ